MFLFTVIIDIKYEANTYTYIIYRLNKKFNEMYLLFRKKLI